MPRATALPAASTGGMCHTLARTTHHFTSRGEARCPCTSTPGPTATLTASTTNLSDKLVSA